MTVSCVVNRRPQAGHARRRRIAVPSSPVRLSMTRLSECLQYGQYTRSPPRRPRCRALKAQAIGKLQACNYYILWSVGAALASRSQREQNSLVDEALAAASAAWKSRERAGVSRRTLPRIVTKALSCIEASQSAISAAYRTVPDDPSSRHPKELVGADGRAAQRVGRDDLLDNVARVCCRLGSGRDGPQRLTRPDDNLMHPLVASLGAAMVGRLSASGCQRRDQEYGNADDSYDKDRHHDLAAPGQPQRRGRGARIDAGSSRSGPAW
jgi:hypothetical protein